MATPPTFDEAAFAQWHKTQQQQVADYLRRSGLFDGDISGEWQWIIPQRAMLGKVWPRGGGSTRYWVISGVVPTDHAEAVSARNCREAARYFALKWQMEAARLGVSAQRNPSEDLVDWKAIGENIADRAEWLYALMHDDARWTADGLPVSRMDLAAA